MTDFENNFFDRKAVLDLLKRRVLDLKEGYRQNVAFLGDRFIGKSSILSKFMSDLDDDGVVTIYLDLDYKNDDYLFAKFIGSLLSGFCKIKKISLHADTALLIEESRKLIPKTTDHIKKIQGLLSRAKLTEAYRELMALPETFTIESGKFCIIILDEFHRLGDLRIPNAFQELGKKIMTQRRCLYIVTSSYGTVAKTILSEKLSLLFGNFEVVPVGPFDLKTSQEFIAYNLRDVRIGDSLRNFLIDFTGGHPFYLNIICQEVVELSAVHRQGEAFLPLLTQAVEKTIFNKWGILSRHFELILNSICQNKGGRLIPLLMIALANGRHKLDEIAHDADLVKNIATQKINRLMEAGIVAKNGNLYYMPDKLFKYWVKYVFQKGFKSIDSHPLERRSEFEGEFSALVNDFYSVSRQGLTSRITELLGCFDDELFSLNGRKYKLSSLKEVTPLKLDVQGDRDFDLLKASSAQGVWFIVLKEGILCEADVNAFMDQSKKLTHKPQRRVIISLNDLDVNTRLKALQEKMWIWNEEELNTLLNLYDKPYILK